MKQRNKPIDIELGRIPPQNVEMEEVVLGGILLEKSAFLEISTILEKDSFYKHEHSIIFEACRELFLKNKPIDIMTVMQELRAEKKLEDCGGPAYLTQLTSRVTSAAHIEYHARIIQQHFLKREMIRISTEISNSCYDESIDVKKIIDSSQESINKISLQKISKTGRKIGDVGKDRIKELSELAKSPESFTGVRSFDKLDKLTAGWQSPDFIILAARPAMGKTRFAQELAKLGETKEKPVAIFELEMKDTQLYDRELASKSGIENMLIRSAKFNEEDWRKIEKAQGEIENMNVIIDDTAGLSIPEFKAKARMLKKKNNIGMIIIDYLQLMTYPEYSKFREQEVSQISKALKSMCKELDIPIIALSQLNRSVETRPNKTPQLSDLRESGSMEQDADVVAFLHRPEYYGITEEDERSTKNLVKLIFAKYRNGPVGDFDFWKSHNFGQIFENITNSKESEEPF